MTAEEKLNVRLTDEEISRALRNQGYTDEVHAELEVVAKAQLKKVVEYIDKNFYIGVDGNGDIEYEGDYRRWQVLLEEVKERLGKR